MCLPCRLCLGRSIACRCQQELTSVAPLCCCHDLFGRILHSLADNEVQPGILEDFSSLLNVSAFESQDDRDFHGEILCRLNYPIGQHIHPQNSAKDVDE